MNMVQRYSGASKLEYYSQLRAIFRIDYIGGLEKDRSVILPVVQWRSHVPNHQTGTRSRLCHIMALLDTHALGRKEL